MSVLTNKTRKIIWSLSGNMCAICKQNLTKNVDEKHLILGQECHIRSPKIKGPRYDQKYPTEKLNSPENLILLCRNHHKEIDDFPKKYTTEYLDKTKKEHEDLTRNNYKSGEREVKIIKKAKYLEAIPITSGMQLIDKVTGACGYSYTFDETDDNQIYELIKDFLSYVEDFDIISDISTNDKLDMAKGLKKIIIGLQNVGYFIFIGIAKDIITGGISGDSDWKTVHFVLTSNKEIKYLLR